MKIFINIIMDYLAKFYKQKAEVLQQQINFLERTLSEQKIAAGETTLDPEFLEKKKRKDQQIELKIERPTEKIEKEAEEDIEKDMKEI